VSSDRHRYRSASSTQIDRTAAVTTTLVTYTAMTRRLRRIVGRRHTSQL
jgi:hypothetical protein